MQHEKECNTKKQLENSVIQKKEQHENSATREKSHMKRVHYEKVQHEKSASWIYCSKT